MDKDTYDIVADFLDDLKKEELIKCLIGFMPYESVVDILEQMKEYDEQTKEQEQE